MATRMYLVELKKKKVLVEAASQEIAIRTATRPMVKSCTIPTALEVARLMRDGVEIISPSIAPAEPPQQEPSGEGVGKLGLQEVDEERLGNIEAGKEAFLIYADETVVTDEGGAVE